MSMICRLLLLTRSVVMLSWLQKSQLARWSLTFFPSEVFHKQKKVSSGNNLRKSVLCNVKDMVPQVVRHRSVAAHCKSCFWIRWEENRKRNLLLLQTLYRSGRLVRMESLINRDLFFFAYLHHVLADVSVQWVGCYLSSVFSSISPFQKSCCLIHALLQLFINYEQFVLNSQRKKTYKHCTFQTKWKTPGKVKADCKCYQTNTLVLPPAAAFLYKDK